MNKQILKLNQEIKPLQKCKLTPVSLEIAGQIKIEEWLKIGEGLKAFSSGTKWWIGDWILYGEQKYGEMYSQGIEKTGLEYDTLKDIKYVASKIEKSGRHDNLSFSHHKAVASLELKEREKWLVKSEKENWDRNQLRNEIKGKKECKHKWETKNFRQCKICGKREFDNLAGENSLKQG